VLEKERENVTWSITNRRSPAKANSREILYASSSYSDVHNALTYTTRCCITIHKQEQARSFSHSKSQAELLRSKYLSAVCEEEVLWHRTLGSQRQPASLNGQEIIYASSSFSKYADAASQAVAGSLFFLSKSPTKLLLSKYLSAAFEVEVLWCHTSWLSEATCHPTESHVRAASEGHTENQLSHGSGQGSWAATIQAQSGWIGLPLAPCMTMSLVARIKITFKRTSTIDDSLQPVDSTYMSLGFA
jgi:hypothetical protein